MKTAPPPTIGSGHTHWFRVFTIAGACTVALIVVALIIVQATEQAAGCGSVDPTDPANYSTVSIRNDIATPVVIGGCKGSYCTPDFSELLDSGRSTSVNAACDASGAEMTSWRVSGIGGSTIGYIAVDTPKRHDGLVFSVSHASANRFTPTPSG